MTDAPHILVSKLSPHLFWDIDRTQFDAEHHSAQLIQRVLEYGELDDWCAVRNYYGMDRIVDDCKKLRTLHPKALAFVCAITGTRKEDYRCYIYRQSHPTPWNS